MTGDCTTLLKRLSAIRHQKTDQNLKKMQGKVCGLCGDFNDNPNNDFTLRSRDVVTGSLDFGNNWRLKESCSRSALNASSDMCEVHQGRKAGAIRQCSIIESEVFAECMKEVWGFCSESGSETTHRERR